MKTKAPKPPTLNEIAKKHGWAYSTQDRDPAMQHVFTSIANEKLRVSFCVGNYGTVTVFWRDMSAPGPQYIDATGKEDRTAITVPMQPKEAFANVLLPLITEQDVLRRIEARLNASLQEAQRRKEAADSAVLRAERLLANFLAEKPST